MSRTGRLREEVCNLLEERGTANTVEIFDHLNGRLIFDHLDDADRARFLNDFQTLRGSATAADSQPTAVGDD